MRSTLLTAQKMAAKLVQEAQTEKENLLKEAREQHAAQLASLEQDKHDAEEKLAMAQQKTAEFIRRSQELCQAQTDFLQSLPELELAAAAPEQPAAAEEKPNDDVISAIEQDILSRYTDPQPEEAKPAVTDEPTIKLPPIESAIPSDFKLSLDELKFGRNYGDKK